MRLIFASFGLTVIALLALGVASLMQSQQWAPRASQSASIAIERCFKLGGVPVLDGWTGNPTNCVFPPHPKEMR